MLTTPCKYTQTYKQILRDALSTKIDPERMAAMGYLQYMQKFHTFRSDFGPSSGKSTAAAEVARDVPGVLLVVKSESEAVRLKRQYRIGNVMSRVQYENGHAGRGAPISLLIFDDCKSKVQQYGARVVHLGGAEC